MSAYSHDQLLVTGKSGVYTLRNLERTVINQDELDLITVFTAEVYEDRHGTYSALGLTPLQAVQRAVEKSCK